MSQKGDSVSNLRPYAIEQRFMPDWHIWARFETKERRDRVLAALKQNPPLLTQEFRARDLTSSRKPPDRDCPPSR